MSWRWLLRRGESESRFGWKSQGPLLHSGFLKNRATFRDLACTPDGWIHGIHEWRPTTHTRGRGLEMCINAGEAGRLELLPLRSATLLRQGMTLDEYRQANRGLTVQFLRSFAAFLKKGLAPLSPAFNDDTLHSMAQRIPIQLHVGNALQWLGTLYRSPSDALKEHVSNAIDEHAKARAAGAALPHCDVVFTFDRRQITVEYPYGMNRSEFETALQRVANSAKRVGTARTIGRLGIGIFSFQQIGRKCTFFTRKTALSETLRVVLHEGGDEASIETALARDRLAAPGLRVVISELKFDPTRPRGPLAPDALRRYLSEKFDAYLREGWLRILIRSGIAAFPIAPARITLPRLMRDLTQLRVGDGEARLAKLDLYFDPSGRGRLAVRHQNVTVVDDLGAAAAYGVEDTAWGEGFVRGTIDADFLNPLPARSGFEEDDGWIALLDTLDRYRPTLEAELAQHHATHRAQQAADIEERAMRLARDILDLDEFRDLALPGGLSKRGRPAPADPGAGAVPGTRVRKKKDSLANAGVDRSPRGRRIRYEEVPFESGSLAHSRFIDGVVQVNTSHPDYIDAARGVESRLAYAALMIGKESIGYNDRSGGAGDFLEKLLDFTFKLQARSPRRRRATKGKTGVGAPPPSLLPVTINEQ